MQENLQKNKVLTGVFGVTSLVLLICSVVAKYTVYASLTNYTVCVVNGVLVWHKRFEPRSGKTERKACALSDVPYKPVQSAQANQGLLMTLLMTYIVVRTVQLSESYYVVWISFVYYFRTCSLGALIGANLYGTGFTAADLFTDAELLFHRKHTPSIALSVIIVVTCLVMLGACVVTTFTLFRVTPPRNDPELNTEENFSMIQ